MIDPVLIDKEGELDADHLENYQKLATDSASGQLIAAGYDPRNKFSPSFTGHMPNCSLIAISALRFCSFLLRFACTTINRVNAAWTSREAVWRNNT
jgi:hypothetical protein